MKVKNLLMGLSLFALVSCGTRLTNPQIPVLEDFRDKNITKAIKVDEAQRKKIERNIENVYTTQYSVNQSGSYGYSQSEITKDYVMNNYNTYKVDVYYDLENKYVETSMQDYIYAFQKVNGEYVTYAQNFPHIDDLLTDEYMDSIFSSTDMFYSWEIFEYVKNMTTPSKEQSIDTGKIKIDYKTQEQKIYHTLVCTEDNGRGDFTIKVEGQMSYTYELTMLGYEYDAEVITRQMEIVYEDYLVSEVLIYYSLIQEPVKENGNIVYSSSNTDCIIYMTYDYNVDEETFTPTFLNGES